MPNQIERALLEARGYTEPLFRVIGPRAVVAMSHKVIDGQIVKAEALGLDREDAERKLIKVITRP